VYWQTSLFTIIPGQTARGEQQQRLAFSSMDVEHLLRSDTRSLLAGAYICIAFIRGEQAAPNREG
jgi:hypothetical protein